MKNLLGILEEQDRALKLLLKNKGVGNYQATLLNCVLRNELIKKIIHTPQLEKVKDKWRKLNFSCYIKYSKEPTQKEMANYLIEALRCIS